MSASLHRRAEASDANRATLVIQRRAARQGAGAYFFLLLATVVLTPLLILVGYDQGYGEVLAIIAALIALIFVPWKPIFGL